jgi:hypothetical protein
MHLTDIALPILSAIGLAACAIAPMPSRVPTPYNMYPAAFAFPIPAPMTPAPVPTPGPYQHVNNDQGRAPTPPRPGPVPPPPRRWIEIDRCNDEWWRVACLLPGVPF